MKILLSTRSVWFRWKTVNFLSYNIVLSFPLVSTESIHSPLFLLEKSSGAYKDRESFFFFFYAGDSAKPDGTISGFNYFFVPLDNNQLQQHILQNANGQQQQQQQAGDQNSGLSNSNSQMTKPKVEPLFVAMAGFVGVAVVFLSAMIFIPRFPFPNFTSKGALKRAPEELATLTRLVAESIDGKDCSERIACEVGRAMRSMQVGTKPIRYLLTRPLHRTSLSGA